MRSKADWCFSVFCGLTMGDDTGSVLEIGMRQIHSEIKRVEKNRCPCVSVGTGEVAHISNTVVWAVKVKRRHIKGKEETAEEEEESRQTECEN